MLENRIALITGGAGALGQAIATAYLREGATVALADVRLDAARLVLKQLGAADAGLAIELDIRDAAQSRRAIAHVVERFGRLDILVNCAAICLVDPFLEVTPERWDEVFAVNTRGAFFCMQAAAHFMMARKYGRIIHISTPASRLGFPDFASYAASKAAVDSMTRAAAIALAPHGITVNCIVPGRMTGGMIDGIENELVRVTGKSAEELREGRTQGLPMGRRVAPAEVARAAVWLASEHAAYVTAERFNFTGGMELA